MRIILLYFTLAATFDPITNLIIHFEHCTYYSLELVFIPSSYFHFCLQKDRHKAECVDLRGAHIEWAKEKSSRKSVFQVGIPHVLNLFLLPLNRSSLG